MAASCAYHPEARGTATCPSCSQFICDRCRINGNSQRCGTCQSIFSKGGEGAPKRVMCENHASTPTDTKCKRCRKPHCQACLNSAELCFRCGMAGPRTPTGPLKSRGTGKLKAPPKKSSHLLVGLAALPRQTVAGGVAAIALLALLGYGVATRKPATPAEPPFTGKAGIQIKAPLASKPLSGVQLIKLEVASKDKIQRIDLTVDGKYWDRWDYGKQPPPYQSEWPTGLVANGPHELVATVYYRGGRRMATDHKQVTTRNKQY